MFTRAEIVRQPGTAGPRAHHTGAFTIDLESDFGGRIVVTGICTRALNTEGVALSAADQRVPLARCAAPRRSLSAARR